MRRDQVVSLSICCVCLVLIGSMPLDETAEAQAVEIKRVALADIAPLPRVKSAVDPVKVAIAADAFPVAAREFVQSEQQLPEISAQAAYVLDVKSQTPLVAFNETASFSIASTAKLMTAVIALETFELEDQLTVKPSHIVEGTAGILLPNDVLTVNQLLHLLLIQSANDAAMVLADNDPDGYAAFIDKMNAKAVELRLDGTHFTNPVGFDNAQQYGTARDLSLLSQAALQHSVIRGIVQKTSDIVTNTASTVEYRITNTNRLLSDPHVVGIKTGTTDAAGEVLITQVEIDEKVLNIVVIGSQDRYTDTLRLIDWVFSWYEWSEYHSTLGTAGLTILPESAPSE